MRRLVLLFALLPGNVLADDIPLVTDVTAVTLYPDGATVTREIPFSAPAGRHELVLTDLPRSTPLASVRATVTGAAMGSVSTRDRAVPPRNPDTDAAIEAAEAEVERIEEELRTARAAIDLIRLEAVAARARTDFLEALGEGEGLAELGVDALRDLSTMIGDQTLDALQAEHGAKLRAAEAERDLKSLLEDLDAARKALQALVPEEKERALLAIAIATDTSTDGTLTVTYNIYEAGWQPVYDLRLTRATGALDIDRGALIRQSTGENWQDVALTLSTVRPSEQTDPSGIWPWLRRIYDPDERARKLSRTEAELGAAADAIMAEPVLEEAPMVVEAAAAFDGLSVTYTYPGPVSVASGADNLRIALGSLTTNADIIAHAVPLGDSTAFLMARITNDTGELILPSYETSYFLDGRFIGQRGLPLIPAAGEAELSFGPIDGLRLSRIVSDRSEGDTGVISKSNALNENVRIEVENLTSESWPVRLFDRVPYSEQEDLEITWSARPRPSATDVDGKRGVLSWAVTVAPGATQEITLSYAAEWPSDMVLE